MRIGRSGRRQRVDAWRAILASGAALLRLWRRHTPGDWRATATAAAAADDDADADADAAAATALSDEPISSIAAADPFPAISPTNAACAAGLASCVAFSPAVASTHAVYATHADSATGTARAAITIATATLQHADRLLCARRAH